MAFICTLSEKQLSNLYNHLYKSMVDSTGPFDVTFYMKDLYKKMVDNSANKEDGQKNAVKFLQSVPRLMATIALDNPSIDIDFDKVRKAQKDFENVNKGFANIVLSLGTDNSLKESAEALAIIYKQRFSKNDNAVDTAEPSTVKKPSSSFTTTFQELLPQDKSKESTIERLNKHRALTYKVLKSIRENVTEEGLLNGTVFYSKPNGDKVSVKLKLYTAEELLTLHNNKEINLQKDFLNILTGSKKLQTDNKLKHPPIKRKLLVLTDDSGNILSFDEDGDIKQASEFANPIVNYLRIVEKTDEGKYKVINYEGKESVQTPQEISNNSVYLTVEEAEELQQKEFERLYKIQESKENLTFNITDVSPGVVLEEGQRKESLNKLGDVNELLDTYGYLDSTIDNFIKGQSTVTINGVKHLLERPNVTEQIITDIINVFNNPKFTIQQKVDFHNQFFPHLSIDQMKVSVKQKHALLHRSDKNTLSVAYTLPNNTIAFINITDKGLGQESIDLLKNLLSTGDRTGRTEKATFLHFNKEILNDKKDFLVLENGELVAKDRDDYKLFLASLGLEVNFINTPINSYFSFSEDNSLADALVEEEQLRENTSSEKLSQTEANKYLEVKNELVTALSDGDSILGVNIGRKTAQSKEFTFDAGPFKNVSFYISPEIESSSVDVTDNVELKLENNNKAKDGLAIAVYQNDKRIGYVRESSDQDFQARKQAESQPSIDQIKQEATKGIVLDRAKELKSKASESQNKQAGEWWNKSPLSKFIKLEQLTDVVNSDAFAKFLIDGTTLVSPDMLGRIELYSDGNMVDVYHEAWHGFSQLFLTKTEKANLYEELRNSNSKYSKMSYLQLEEVLAEDFRSYAKKQKSKADSPKRNSLFRRILNFLNKLFGKLPYVNVANVASIPSVKELYDNLYYSSNNPALLAKYKPSLENVMFSELNRAKAITSTRYAKEIVLSTSDSILVSRSIDSIISELVDAASFHADNKAYIIAMLRGANKNALYENVKKMLQAKLTEHKKALGNVSQIDFNLLTKESSLEKNAVAVIERSNGAKVYGFLSSQIESFDKLLPELRSGDKLKGQQYHGINIVTDFYKHTEITTKSTKGVEERATIIVGNTIDEINNQFLNLKDASELKGWKSIELKKESNLVPLNTAQINTINSIRIIEKALANWGDEKSGTMGYHLSNTEYSFLNAEKFKQELENSESVDENNEDIDLSDPEAGKDSEDFADRKQGKKSVWATAHPQFKYLIKSLHKIDKLTGKPVKNELGFLELADSYTVWGILLKNLAGLQSPQAMYDKLVELAKTKKDEPTATILPEIKQILNKITDPNKAIDYANNFDMVSAMFHTFNKTEVPYKQTTFIQQEDGSYDVKVITASMQDVMLIAQWQNKFKTQEPNNETVTKDKKGNRILEIKEIIKRFGQPGNKKELHADKVFYFLQAIGIKLDDLKVIKDDLKENYQNYGVKYLYDVLVKADEINDKVINKQSISETDRKTLNSIKYNPVQAFSKEITLAGTKYNYRNNLRKLATLQANKGIESLNTGIPNAAGETVYPHIDNNAITRIINALSQGTSFSNMLEMFPYMSYLDPAVNHYTSRLQLVNNLYDIKGSGKRNIKNDISTFMNSGTQIINNDGTSIGMNTTDLDKFSYLNQNIHSLLMGGIQEMPRHASKKTSIAIQFTGNKSRKYTNVKSDSFLYIPTEAFVSEESTIEEKAIESIFIPYLAGEYARIKQIRNNKELFKNYKGYNTPITNSKGETFMAGELFTAFDDLLSIATQDKLYALINKYPNLELEQILDSTEFISLKNEIVSEIKEYFKNMSKDVLDFAGKNTVISKSLLEKAGDDRSKVFKSFAYNSWIQNFESAILVYGDMAQYNHMKEELHKRNTGSTSGGPGFRTDVAAKSFINDVFLKKANYAESLGVKAKEYNGILNTAIVEDVVIDSSLYLDDIESGLSDYYKSIGKSEKEIKELLEKDLKPYKGMEEGDGAGYISIDTYRILKKLENDWSDTQEDLFKKMINNEEIDYSQVKEFFSPYKLQNFGHLAEAKIPALAMHKFALFPLIPSVIKGSDLQSLHDQMIKSGTDYVTFATGSKGVSISSNGKPDKIYENKELLSNINFTHNKIYVEYLKKASAVNSSYKGKIVYPTQKRGLLLNHLYAEGFAINDNLKEVAKKYENIVSEYSQIVKLELLTEMGLAYDEKNKTYTGDHTKFIELASNELEARDLPKHLLDEIKTNAKGVISKDFSYHVSTDKIEQVLTSLIEKRLIKQSVKGEPMVQMPASMFNGIWDSTPEVLTDVEAKALLGSNNLPFYNRGKKLKNGTYENTDPMRIAIALQGPFLNLLKAKYKGQEIGNIDTLNIAIKDSEWLKENQDLIRIVGDRIPIQDHGSLEFAQIHHFLPTNSSNIVVVPSEMVAKAGSDFDVDKIFWQFPEIGSDGNLVHSDLSFSDINKLIEANDKTAFNEIKKKKKSLNNELMKANADILSNSKIYTYLIKPNNTYLWQELSQKMEKYYDNEYNRYKNYTIEGDKKVLVKGKEQRVISPTRTLEPLYQVHKLDVNMVGKDGLGIEALENKIHPILKSIGMKMPKRIQLNKLLSVPTSLMFEHNKTENGNISLAHEYNKNGNKISDLSSHLMNGLVDVEKDAWVFYVRANLKQLPVLNYMAQAGVAEDNITYFLSQPLTRKYVDKVLEFESLYSNLNSKVKWKSDLLKEIYDSIPAIEGRYNSDLYNANKLRMSGLLGSLKDDLLINYNGKEVSVSLAKKMLESASEAPIIKIDKDVYKPIESLANREILPFLEQYLKTNLNIESFKQTDLLSNLDNPKVNYSLLALVHFLNIESQIYDYSNAKRLFNPDTNVSKSPNLSYNRKQLFEEAMESPNVDKESLIKLKNESILSSFFANDIADEILKPFFKLRLHPKVLKEGSIALRDEKAKIKRKFGAGTQGHAKFFTAYHNAIITTLYQNNMSYVTNNNGAITETPVFYKGLDLFIDAKQEELSKVIGSKLHINKTKIDSTYSSDLVNKTEFPNKELYIKYLLELAVQKQMYPNLSEADVSAKAKIFAFNPNAILKDALNGYSTQLLEMISTNELDAKYDILKMLQIAEFPAQKGFSILTLANRTDLDAAVSTEYANQLMQLADFTVDKVKDKALNYKISEYFSIFTDVLVYQHGFGYSRNGINQVLPQTQLLNKTISMGDKFISNQLSAETPTVLTHTLNVLFDTNNVKEYVVQKVDTFNQTEIKSIEPFELSINLEKPADIEGAFHETDLNVELSSSVDTTLTNKGVSIASLGITQSEWNNLSDEIKELIKSQEIAYTPNFNLLKDVSGVNEYILAAEIKNWQDIQGVDYYPSLTDLNIENKPMGLLSDSVAKETMIYLENLKALSETNNELRELLINFVEENGPELRTLEDLEKLKDKVCQL
jgi:hypothetical protein